MGKPELDGTGASGGVDKGGSSLLGKGGAEVEGREVPLVGELAAEGREGKRTQGRGKLPVVRSREETVELP